MKTKARKSSASKKKASARKALTKSRPKARRAPKQTITVTQALAVLKKKLSPADFKRTSQRAKELLKKGAQPEEVVASIERELEANAIDSTPGSTVPA